jgi:hypothetical protein
MIENTTKRDNTAHLLGMNIEGRTGYIEGMEAEGGRQFQSDATLMPASGPWPELVALGFAEPEATDDELFVRTKLPAGWSKRSMEDARGGEIVDERGLPRVGTFYKAAFYDRKASCHLIGVGHHLATDAIYGDEEPARPAQWDVLTTQERQGYLNSLDGYLHRAERYPSTYEDRVQRVQALKAAVRI